MKSPTFHDTSGKKIIKPSNEKIYWRVSAYGILVSSDNKILMVQMPWNPKWAFPGGGVEPDESIFEGLSREFYEETGYKISKNSALLIHTNESYFFENIESNKFYHSINLFYKIGLKTSKQHKEVINTFSAFKEIEKINWVPIKDLTKDNCYSTVFDAMQSIKK